MTYADNRMKMLNGKNAIITGARKGIGRATVEKFASLGANIWACIRTYDEQFEEEMSTLANTMGVSVTPVYFDVADETQVKKAIKAILSEKRSVDVLVNVAGIVSANRLISMTPMSEIRRVFDTNFFSSIFLVQLVSRVMMRQKNGAIVNISSIAGIDGDPAQLEYSSSKAALISATKKMASEFGPYGIRVNCVAPGLTETSMVENMEKKVRENEIARTCLKRSAEPEEIANAIAFLSSDLASYITAQVIRVDGGVLPFNF